MKKLLTIVFMFVMMGAHLTPTQQRDLVQKRTGVKTDHITVHKKALPYYIKGVACNPFMIITNSNYWDSDNNHKNYIHIMHEIGHAYGLFHDSDRINGFYRNTTIDIPETSMHSPSPTGLEYLVYSRYYNNEFKKRIETGNIKKFWIQTVPVMMTVQSCINSVVVGGFDERSCERGK